MGRGLAGIAGREARARCRMHAASSATHCSQRSTPCPGASCPSGGGAGRRSGAAGTATSRRTWRPWRPSSRCWRSSSTQACHRSISPAAPATACPQPAGAPPAAVGWGGPAGPRGPPAMAWGTGGAGRGGSTGLRAPPSAGRGAGFGGEAQGGRGASCAARRGRLKGCRTFGSEGCSGAWPGGGPRTGVQAEPVDMRPW